MKTSIAIALILVAFVAGSSSIAISLQDAAAAKECTDCGCDGADAKGSCPMEKGKKCHCQKK